MDRGTVIVFSPPIHPSDIGCWLSHLVGREVRPGETISRIHYAEIVAMANGLQTIACVDTVRRSEARRKP